MNNTSFSRFIFIVRWSLQWTLKKSCPRISINGNIYLIAKQRVDCNLISRHCACRTGNMRAQLVF
jgi:hypothetical protein